MYLYQIFTAYIMTYSCVLVILGLSVSESHNTEFQIMTEV